MRDVMYRINRSPRGVILVCIDCQHTEHVNQFDATLGSCRTQAANAMLKHVLNDHGKPPVGLLKPQTIERRY